MFDLFLFVKFWFFDLLINFVMFFGVWLVVMINIGGYRYVWWVSLFLFIVLYINILIILDV